MATQAETVKSDIAQALYAVLSPRRVRRPSSHPLFEQVLSLQKPLLAQSWPELMEASSECLGRGYVAFRNLQADATGVATLDELMRRTSEGYRTALQIIANGKGSSEFIKDAQKRLQQGDVKARFDAWAKKLQSSGRTKASPEVIAKLRAALSPTSSRIDFEKSMEDLASHRETSLLDALSLASKNCLASGLAQDEDIAILCLCRGLLGILHARFNLAFQADVSAKRPLPSNSDVKAVKSIIDEFEARLRHGQQEVYSSMLRGQPAADVCRAAAILAGDVECSLPAFAAMQASLRVATGRLLDKKSHGLAKQFGSLGVEAFALTREAIASHAASYRLAAALTGSSPKTDIAALLSRTSAMPFSAALPNGLNTEVKKLDAKLDGVLVEVQGFVTDVKVNRQNDGKLISIVTVVDPANQASVDAVAIFAHLPHAGVTKGAFCRFNGTFRSKSTLLKGTPAVEVDVLSLGELAKTNWRIAFLQLADRWFQPWRNGANFYWSLGPHAKGDEGEDLLGAGELLFTPFVRQ